MLDEIQAGIFDGWTYEDIEKQMPQEYAARKADKLKYRCDFCVSALLCLAILLQCGNCILGTCHVWVIGITHCLPFETVSGAWLSPMLQGYERPCHVQSEQCHTDHFVTLHDMGDMPSTSSDT